jgi:hypothetical protein
MAMFGISNHLLVGFFVQFVGMQHLAKGVSQVAVAAVAASTGLATSRGRRRRL